MKPILITSGEPAGIGPDLCLTLAGYPHPLVVIGDRDVLAERAINLRLNLSFEEYQIGKPPSPKVDTLTIIHLPCAAKVQAGQLTPKNARYVLDMLTLGAQLCQRGDFTSLVTAPVHKANINTAGYPFSGHTEFFAEFFGSDNVVMMLACDQMKVALVTTHIPLKQVSASLSIELIIQVIRQVHSSLIRDFSIKNPKLFVAGLNPHAGESGYLGNEEIELIIPAINQVKKEGIGVEGPFPGDTMFISDHSECDAFIAMYHDQGLPVLKYVGFNKAVNITLGLPIIRTSVDHGTALELAGTKRADNGSIMEAVNTARTMAKHRMQK